jgi:hypothetical protein
LDKQSTRRQKPCLAPMSEKLEDGSWLSRTTSPTLTTPSTLITSISSVKALLWK